jgi:hypothetical protein
MTSDPILAESIDCLRAHLHREWGDRSPDDVFYRLVAKNKRPPGWTKTTHLDPASVSIVSRREAWLTDKFATLTRGHASQVGKDFPCPIVLVEFLGEVLVLDGNHRINRWVATGDKASHAVNIHNLSGDPKYVELPPVRTHV